MDIIKPCPTCKGTLIEGRYIQTGVNEEDGRPLFIWDGTFPCTLCLNWETPGAEVIMTINLSGIEDKIDDIQDKLNDILERLRED